MRILQLMLFLAVLLASTGSVQADVEDFVIHNFHGRYVLDNDVNGGSMLVTEDIELTFNDNNHGILRALPEEYRGNPLKLEIISVVRDGNPEPYTTYGDSGHTVLKIGDPDRTITGPHTYQIKYQMVNIISFFESHDEWFWDINGLQWRQPFEHVSGEVVFPAGWHDNGLPSGQCYTGSAGERDQACSMQQSDNGYTFATTQTLAPGETLTVVAAAPKGLFTPRTTLDWLADNWWQLAGLVFGVTGSIGAFAIWWRWGKDHPERGVTVPEYQPPRELSPAEVGLLADYRVNGRDLTAAIIGLAVRGYIKIYDEKPPIWKIFKKHEFTLELTDEETDTFKPHEKKLLTTIFEPYKAGTQQKLSDIDKNKMGKTAQDIKKSLREKLTDTYGLFEEVPKRYQIGLFLVSGAAITAIAVFTPGWGWIMGLLLLSASSIFFGVFMRRRSHAGVEVYEKIQGLKLYMETAEAERLQATQSVESPYGPPDKTRQLFEELLPYAIALGVEKSWAQQFEDIYTTQPDWYSGNYASFSMANFTNGLNSAASAMNSRFSSSSSSSGSGFSGGAGGGGGGGGGGGW